MNPINRKPFGEPEPSEVNPPEVYDERADYDDSETPRKKLDVANTSYLGFAKVFVIYGILFFVAAVVLVGVAIFNYRIHPKGDMWKDAVRGLISVLFSGALFLILARKMYSCDSLWPLRTLSILCCMSGAAFTFGVYPISTFVGVLGLLTAQKVAFRERLRKTNPDDPIWKDELPPEQCVLVDPKIRDRLLSSDSRLIAEFNRTNLSWYFPATISVLVASAVLVSVVYNMVVSPNQAGLVAFMLLFFAATFLPALLAFILIRYRQAALLVWIIIAGNFLFGLIPFLGAVHHLFGCWLLVLMYSPEVRPVYGQWGLKKDEPQ